MGLSCSLFPLLKHQTLVNCFDFPLEYLVHQETRRIDDWLHLVCWMSTGRKHGLRFDTTVNCWTNVKNTCTRSKHYFCPPRKHPRFNPCALRALPRSRIYVFPSVCFTIKLAHWLRTEHVPDAVLRFDNPMGRVVRFRTNFYLTTWTIGFSNHILSRRICV